MKRNFFRLLFVASMMISMMANAQYLNVKLDNGTCHSYKSSAKTEVSFGKKQGTDVTESEQMVTVGNYKVTVKLADDTPASEVALHAFIEGDKVKIKAMCWDGYGLECIKDNEVLAPDVDNGFHTFTVSDISKDMVVTIGYITVCFDLNNSNITDNFKAKPADITKMRYGSTIPQTYTSAERHSFRGWYKDANCTIPWDYKTDKVTKSITLYAKWAEDPIGTQINGHDFVKLGGYYWATKNVTGEGANYSAIAIDDTYGYYFYTQTNNNALNAAKSWGGEGNYSWTLPSAAQWQALIDYCNWTWYTNYNGTGINGFLVKGKEGTYESDHNIFLHLTGTYDNYYKEVKSLDSGYYWSSGQRKCLDVRSDRFYVGDLSPDHGMAVRPVLAE